MILNTIEELKTKLHTILEGYDPKDIANGDETSLFHKALPWKFLTLKRDSCAGGKYSKERITIFICGL